jgi:hypothetical protein
MLPSNWLTALLALGVGIIGVVFFLQVLWPRLRTRFAPPADPEARTHDLLDQYRKASSEEPISKPFSLTLRLLRAAHTTDRDVTCLFVNEGPTVMNLQVTAKNGVEVEFDPSKLLESRQAGSIKLHIPPGYTSGQVPLDIRYDDAAGYRSSERYVYVIMEKRLIYEPAGIP